MVHAHPWRALAASLLLVVNVAAAQTSSSPATEKGPGHAAIASANFHATDAGFEVLAKGGNAFDAAVAVSSTLAVVEPQSSGIGGGFMAMLHRASDNRDIFLDARETAPKAVDMKVYVGKDGKPNRDTSMNGPLSAGIPGEPAGIVWMAEHYGKLPLRESLAPAIRIAREGFQPDERFLAAIDGRKEVLARWPASASLLLPNGKVPQKGWTLRQPDLAATLERLAEKGVDGFYAGETAKMLVSASRAAGGNWTAADLASYRVKEREPLTVDYRGYRIVTAPPPSSGGVAIAEILNILSGFDLTRLDKAHATHLVIESMRRAFRDHNEYLGDPDFVKMPLDMLLSRYYADGLRATISPDKATPSDLLPAAMATDPGMHTTHFSVIDAEGNMVGSTLTVNLEFGSAFVAKGTGVLLNDEMDDFALVPGQPNAFGLRGAYANAPEPGKRMLSSMSPSFVFGKDRTAVIGSPGGSTIITQVLEGILAFVDGKSAADIAAQKRFHHQYLPDRVDVEAGVFDEATAKTLTDMGHVLKDRSPWGFMNVVIWDHATNRLDAASDPRRPSGLGKVQ
ncbi:gamma-glutamyltranspeptidase/glutathione hydrolase [Luteibacter sp. Sphag1AF]|uniref:gamma-glutamyltransferase n=1 Tax=Luteibacter sp. Sphag1AF TaxID=2587031 RepID=UPI00160C5BDF|nr:gamma-glutamyltransferase [Luteibacter sp. Sphag1AF]MBB3225625.1 gamma-glutamyltranspeptidase/glutathione hydrolase [Luteibacter sp. Sphag1AF]